MLGNHETGLDGRLDWNVDLQEMYAGVPEMGAVDAWYEALAKVEELKLDGKAFCGRVADIAKFVDQVRRGIVYNVPAAVGLPPMILSAYKAYIENLLLNNCLAGGIRRPHKGRCGMPRGCPFSMMMAALIMRP